MGPNIADSYALKPAQLLTDILEPNRAIDGNYFAYTVVTTDGRVLSGIISNETATALTLRQPEGKSVTLLREEIDEIESTRTSLMPVGLEKDITLAEMADLIAFLINWRYLDGSIPLADPPVRQTAP